MAYKAFADLVTWMQNIDSSRDWLAASFRVGARRWRLGTIGAAIPEHIPEFFRRRAHDDRILVTLHNSRVYGSGIAARQMPSGRLLAREAALFELGLHKIFVH